MNILQKVIAASAVMFCFGLCSLQLKDEKKAYAYSENKHTLVRNQCMDCHAVKTVPLSGSPVGNYKEVENPSDLPPNGPGFISIKVRTKDGRWVPIRQTTCSDCHHRHGPTLRKKRDATMKKSTEVENPTTPSSGVTEDQFRGPMPPPPNFVRLPDGRIEGPFPPPSYISPPSNWTPGCTIR